MHGKAAQISSNSFFNPGTASEKRAVARLSYTMRRNPFSVHQLAGSLRREHMLAGSEGYTDDK